MGVRFQPGTGILPRQRISNRNVYSPEPPPGRRRYLKSALLNRFGLRISGGCYVGRRIVERPAGLERNFFVLRPDSSNGIVPAVIPTDAGFAIHHGPGTVAGANGFAGLAIFFESDIEIASVVSFAHFPLADEVGAAGKGRAGRALELNASFVGRRDGKLVSILENDDDGVFEFDVGDVCHVEILPVPVRIDDYDRFRAAGGRPTTGRGKNENCRNTNCPDDFVHGLSSCVPLPRRAPTNRYDRQRTNVPQNDA